MEFIASSVFYNEAIDGEIVQVWFEEKLANDSLKPNSCSATLSVNYEFPPCELDIEWCDGKEDYGGVKHKRYLLNQAEFKIWMVDGTFIAIAFNIDSDIYSKISALVERHWGNQNA